MVNTDIKNIDQSHELLIFYYEAHFLILAQVKKILTVEATKET